MISCQGAASGFDEEFNLLDIFAMLRRIRTPGPCAIVRTSSMARLNDGDGTGVSIQALRILQCRGWLDGDFRPTECGKEQSGIISGKIGERSERYAAIGAQKRPRLAVQVQAAIA